MKRSNPKLPEDLRVKLIVIASERGISVRGLHPMELVTRLMKLKLSSEDEEVMKQICDFYGPGHYERLRRKRGPARRPGG